MTMVINAICNACKNTIQLVQEDLEQLGRSEPILYSQCKAMLKIAPDANSERKTKLSLVVVAPEHLDSLLQNAGRCFLRGQRLAGNQLNPRPESPGNMLQCRSATMAEETPPKPAQRHGNNRHGPAHRARDHQRIQVSHVVADQRHRVFLGNPVKPFATCRY